MLSSSAVVQAVTFLGLVPLPVISFTLDQRSIIPVIYSPVIQLDIHENIKILVSMYLIFVYVMYGGTKILLLLSHFSHFDLVGLKNCHLPRTMVCIGRGSVVFTFCKSSLVGLQ